MVAGCGGGGGTRSTESASLVSGASFSYRAPSGWAVTVTPREAVAKQDEVTLVSVTVLPLVKAYNPALFPRVVTELDRVAGTLAARLHGTVSARRTVQAAGGKVRQYEIDHGELADRLTFVLRGKREFLLTCRWRSKDGAPGACDQLVASFGFRSA